MAEKIPDNEAFEALQKIKRAEDKAKDIIQEAREKTSLQIVQDAYEEAEKIKMQILKEAKEKAARKKKEIIERAEKEQKKIQKETDQEISELHRNTRSLMPKAVEKIGKKVEQFLLKGGL